MPFRMTFGGAPCQALWGCLSDTLVDIYNALINTNAWDHRDLFNPLSTMIGSKLSLHDSIPLHPAKPIAADMPAHNRSFVDIFIDDSIAVVPDIDDYVTGVSYAIPLAIHSIARPIDTFGALPRKDLISMKKVFAEGHMKEQKTRLGWCLDTRSLPIFFL